jgi:methylated-DNA-[protein]-cysteine S-methyltransferase
MQKQLAEFEMMAEPQQLARVAEQSACLETPFGPIGLRWRAGLVTGVSLSPGAEWPQSHAVPDWLRTPLEAFLEQSRDHPADPCGDHWNPCRALPTAPAGSPFQRRVWQAISAIPSGRTRTYGEIAAELGSAPRAVGGACRANPYPLLVPCHRVIGAAGLGGFAGDASGRLIAIKRWLLAHEGVALPS